MNKKIHDKESLDQLAKEFRYVVTDCICRFGTGHIGGALSLVETVITLYYRVMNVRPQEPNWIDRDRLVLSKGHAGPVVYTALAYQKFFPMQWLTSLNQDGTNLPSHMDQRLTPGVDMTTGSLGQGLSCACGIALSGKINSREYTTYCIIGDGESNEGQIWEAALFAVHNRLDNLVVICDYNKLQIDGFTKEILDLEPLVNKWQAFGWETFSIDGHDWDELYTTLNRAKEIRGKPSMIIANTIKGKGNCETENMVTCHNIMVPDQKTYNRYICGLKYTDIELPY